MKYLCLCYYDEAMLDRLTKSELEALARECQPHDENLKNSGHLLAQASLSLPRAAITMRAGNGSPTVSEGAYADTKEPVGAFFIIEARDLNEAIQVASKHPGTHVSKYLGGGIELRAIEKFEQFQERKSYES